MRASARCPCTVWPANVPGPSKRTLLTASVFETYSLPLTGLAAMLNKRRADVREGCRLLQRIRVDDEHVGIGQSEAHRAVPDAVQFVLPMAVLLNFTISPTSGAGSPGASVAGPGLPPGLVVPSDSVHGLFGLKSRADPRLVDGGRLVAGLEPGHVHRVAIGSSPPARAACR